MASVLDAAIGDPYYTDPVLSIPDEMEQIKMNPFQPGTSQGMQWWQSAINYGITRAIDNRYGPQQTAGNVQAGSFAGAGGQSVLNNGSGVIGGQLVPGVGNQVLLLVGLGLAVFLIARG